MVKISFIVPCYNVANYIENSLLRWEPLLSQNVEFIFIDDGSQDDTIITLEKSLKGTTFNSKIITVSNQGVSSARNFGLSEAVGDYVVFLDSDDYFENGYLNFICDALSSSQELDLIITNFDMVDELGNQIRFFKSNITSISEPLMQYLKGDITCHLGSLCINRNFLVEHDIKFPIGVAVGEDLIFTVKLFEYAIQERIRIVNLSFFRYVVISSSVMNSEISMKHYEGMEKIKSLINLPRGYERVFYRYVCLKLAHVIKRSILQGVDSSVSIKKLTTIISKILFKQKACKQSRLERFLYHAIVNQFSITVISSLIFFSSKLSFLIKKSVSGYS
ncbi:hypothetical protein CW749_27245 [Vibrio sp. vnigr-6D03]|uniref:glycosyltransferase family 2 protein n=1 Tax=Vibrio sp. vnigr-6D03 TaxID=2058088 RepID=UPI000C336D46|nr:glycosyltransferase family 2 protein [Vibrio sp. vnigr-6D03]PKF76396.1 hypothetical protein CW749_27245 [Vibrio sp. vnigr-6D03]